MQSETNYILWDELEIGQSYGPVTFSVENDRIKKYIAAVQGNYNDYYLTANLGEDLSEHFIVPPTMAAVYLLEAFKLVPSPPGGIHAKQNFKFYSPARTSDTLYTTLTIAEKYIKRDKKYVDTVTETVNQNKQPIVKSWSTRIWAR